MKMTVKLKIVWHLKSLPEQPVRKVKYLKSHSKLHPPRLQPTTLILERKNNESNLVDDQHRATMSVANDVNKQLNDSFPDVVELPFVFSNHHRGLAILVGTFVKTS